MKVKVKIRKTFAQPGLACLKDEVHEIDEQLVPRLIQQGYVEAVDAATPGDQKPAAKPEESRRGK
jgi:hypothetical protein